MLDRIKKFFNVVATVYVYVVLACEHRAHDILQIVRIKFFQTKSHLI